MPRVHFSTEALRMRSVSVAPVFLLQKNIAPAEAARADINWKKQLGRGQLLVPYINYHSEQMCIDSFFPWSCIWSKTLKMLVKNHLLLSLSQHRTFGSSFFFSSPQFFHLPFSPFFQLSVRGKTQILNTFL